MTNSLYFGGIIRRDGETWMGARLQALRELQDIELQIVDIRQQCAKVERRVAAQQRKLDRLRSELEARKIETRRDQARFDQLDVEIKARNANIEKLREHLNTVRTNKEYAAILAQINNEKADTSKIEAQGMELMQAVDAAKQRLADDERQASAEQERLGDLQQELEQTRSSFAARLDKLNVLKSQALEALDPESAQLFARVSERYEGEVLAEVIRPNPRRDEFLCSGCHMNLRAEIANALKTRDEVQTCRNCGRILYIEPGT